MITKPWSIITNVCVARRKIIYFARNIASWKNTRRPQKLSKKLEESFTSLAQVSSSKDSSWRSKFKERFKRIVLESTPGSSESTLALWSFKEQCSSRLRNFTSRLRLRTDKKTESWFSVLQCSSRLRDRLRDCRSTPGLQTDKKQRVDFQPSRLLLQPSRLQHAGRHNG